MEYKHRGLMYCSKRLRIVKKNKCINYDDYFKYYLILFA